MNALKDQIYILETQLLHADVRNSRSALDNLLSENFLEFAGSGKIFDKKKILDSLPGAPTPKFIMHDFAIHELSPVLILATYKMEKQDGESEFSLRSSIWQKEQNAWKMLFHQGTNLTN
jgi:hypothetical protein